MAYTKLREAIEKAGVKVVACTVTGEWEEVPGLTTRRMFRARAQVSFAASNGYTCTIAYQAGIGAVESDLVQAGIVKRNGDEVLINRFRYDLPVRFRSYGTAKVQQERDEKAYRAMLKHWQPSPVNVIACLFLDASGIAEGQTFDSWLDELGMCGEPLCKYKEYRRMYEACQENWQHAQRFFGGALARELLDTEQAGELED
jgi:peroxiredoxin family protein